MIKNLLERRQNIVGQQLIRMLDCAGRHISQDAYGGDEERHILLLQMADNSGEDFGLDHQLDLVFASVAVVRNGPAAISDNLLIRELGGKHPAEHCNGGLHKCVLG